MGGSPLGRQEKARLGRYAWRGFGGALGRARCELINEVFQEPARARVSDSVVAVHQLGLERNIGLSAHHQRTEVAEHAAQMLLRDRNADRAVIQDARRRFDRAAKPPG
jgi:hypothetical protein